MQRFFPLLCGLIVGCAQTDDSSDDGYAVTIETTLLQEEGQVPFVTANGTEVWVPNTDLVGKPYVISIFEGGFSQGNDEPLDLVWGTVPEDLIISETGSHGYLPGPYDASVIIYVNSVIDEQADPIAPVAGDLSAFTLDTRDVLEGDPTFEAGVVRVNVIDGDVTKHLGNHTADDPSDSQQLQDALYNTILVVP